MNKSFACESYQLTVAATSPTSMPFFCTFLFAPLDPCGADRIIIKMISSPVAKRNLFWYL